MRLSCRRLSKRRSQGAINLKTFFPPLTFRRANGPADVRIVRLGKWQRAYSLPAFAIASITISAVMSLIHLAKRPGP